LHGPVRPVTGFNRSGKTGVAVSSLADLSFPAKWAGVGQSAKAVPPGASCLECLENIPVRSLCMSSALGGPCAVDPTGNVSYVLNVEKIISMGCRFN